mmetsp:Transcript_123016/g.192164  ORF Transcript_123016/g.192164 Transcript_123016/m.192164 type:complete len:325 (+) Transcript_123016:49-1023(+)
MSSRPGVVVASRRSSATRATGSAVAKASAPFSSRNTTGSSSTTAVARSERGARSPQQITSTQYLATATNAPLRRTDHASSRPIAAAARASLSQNKATVTSRSPRYTSSAITRGVGNLVPHESPTREAPSSSLDDESLALLLAQDFEDERLQDEAFALALAREQEETSTSDAALAAALVVADARVSPQPWPELGAGDLAALAAAAAMRSGSGGMFGFSDPGLEEVLALSVETAGYNASASPRHTGPTKSQIQRLPTRLVSSETLGTGDDGMCTECAVCFAPFSIGEELRTLPCMHCFHTECIDRWLTSGRAGATSCPVCHCELDL